MESTLKTYPNGDKTWRLNGKLHREDGPAIEYANGDKTWWLNGKLHRIDGPSAAWVDGDKWWYLDGFPYSFENWKNEVGNYYDTQEDYLLMLLKLD